MPKIAIVTSEGGLSCAYSVGVILGLVKKYKLVQPYLVVGSSGSTGTLAYFVARQYDSIRHIWEYLLSTKKFVPMRRLHKIMDIDYLIDEIFKKQDRLNSKSVKRSKIKFFISATNAKNGRSVYFSNHGNIDIFEALRASSAIPVAYNKQVKINLKSYIDGAFAAPIYKNVKKAQREGANKIIAVNNVNEGWLAQLSLRIYSLFISRDLGQTIHKYLAGGWNRLPHGRKIFVISPSKKLPTDSLDNNPRHLKQAIKLGFDDVMGSRKLANFLTN